MVKRKQNRRISKGLMVGMALAAPAAWAGSKFWDTDGSSVNGLQSGNGTWDTGSTALWSTVATGDSPLTTWADGDDAFFQTGGANDVTLSALIQALTLTQSGAGTVTTLGGAGTLQINSDAGIVNSGNSLLTINSNLTLNSAAVIFNTTNGGNISVGGVIGQTGGTRGINKLGAGTLTISTAATYGGTTRLGGGSIVLSGGNNRLPTATTLNIAATSTLDVGSTSQSIANMTAGTGSITATFTGTNGSLILDGNQDWSIGSGTAAITLNMSNLGTFTYNNPTKAIHLGSQGNAGSTNNVTVTFGANNTITANSFGIADVTSGATASTNRGTIHLGQSNSVNVNSLIVGDFKSVARLDFASGLVDPTLTLRSTNGGAVPTFIIGRNQSNGLDTNATVDLRGGITDAQVTSLVIGNSTNNTTQTRAATGTLQMGAGTLVANLITVGKYEGTGGNSGAAANGTLELANGGTIQALTLTLSDKISGGAAAVARGTVELTNGTLKVGTLQHGTGTGQATFNWNGGNIQNYNASTNGTVSGTNLNLILNGGVSGAAARQFTVDSGRTVTVNAAILDGTGSVTTAYSKEGLGTLILNAASGYTGATTITAGRLLANNSTGSATGSGPVTVSGGGTLGGSGFIGGRVTVEGLITGGAVNAAGRLTLTSTHPTAALDLSTGTGLNQYLFDLTALKDDVTGIAGTDFDQITLSGAGGNLRLGGDSSLNIVFNGLPDPNSSDPFWEANHVWHIITLSNGATNSGNSNFSSIVNGSYANGSFSTGVDGATGDVLLNFTTSVPEPGSIGLLASAAGVLLARRRRRG